MGNVNTSTNKKSTTNQNKQLVLNEIQQKIQMNLRKQNNKKITKITTSQKTLETDQIFTYRKQCQSARSLLENQPILSNR